MFAIATRISRTELVPKERILTGKGAYVALFHKGVWYENTHELITLITTIMMVAVVV